MTRKEKANHWQIHKVSNTGKKTIQLFWVLSSNLEYYFRFFSFFLEFLENQTVPDAGEGWFDGKEAINEEREADGLDYNSSYGE
jgi:hypothetical protein